MDFGNMLGDSFAYTKEALMEKWVKWILLIIPFMSHGYSLEIFRGAKPAPEVNDWVATFINGIKLFIIMLIYCIPLLIIIVIAAVLGAGAALTGDSSAIMAAGLIVLVAMLVAAIYCIILIIIGPIAVIRFARTNSFGEAFNFGAILASIGKIGWGTYIIALIVLFVAALIFGIIISIINFILMLIPFLGILLNLILQLVLTPPITIFSARYFTQVYDSAA